MKKLNEIIKTNYDILIKDIKIDSREVEKGDLFIAVKGFNVDHSNYIEDAIKRGCSVVITDIDYDSSIPIIKVKDVNKTLTEVSKKMYDFDDSMMFIGVTGTDGKTTTATIIKEILSNYKNTAYIGTNGIDVNNKSIKTNNTTPTTPYLYKYTNLIKKEDTYNISMEVSSEALLHGRVDGINYKYAIFTNIKEDHLNIHKTLDNYIKSKMKLINLVNSDGYIIVNGDDSNLKRIKDKRKITFGKNKNNNFIITDVVIKKDNTFFKIKHKNNIYEIKTKLVGEYNIYNITAAFIICYLEGISVDNIINSIKRINYIKGRGEKIDYGQNYKIILDYAHTLNGIKSIVSTYKKLYSNIIVVTGAAGGREKEKRKLIGKYLLDNVNLVIFTMDDPRYESVDSIINDMLSCTKKDNYIRINDRKKAIIYTLDNAKKGDLILILGKGRDEYMAIEDKKIYYSDYEEIKKYFQK